MPQMAPISWLSLFLLFSMIFIMFNVMNFFIYMPSTPKSKSVEKISTNSLTWKW